MCEGRRQRIMLFSKQNFISSRFMGAESIVYQYAGLAIRSFFCLRVKNVSNLIQTDSCIYISTVGVTIMLSQGRMSCPSAAVGGSRPND